MILTILRTRHGIFLFLLMVLLAGVLFLFMLKPAAMEWAHEREKFKKFPKKQSVLNLENIVDSHKPDEYIELLVKMAQQNHVVIQTANLLKPDQNENPVIELTAISHFPDFYHFLIAMRQSAREIMLDDFDWRVEKDQRLHIHAKIYVARQVLPVMITDVAAIKINRDPFLFQDKNGFPDSGHRSCEEMKKISIHQLRFAGSVVWHEKRRAFLGDDSGKIWMVNVGEKIGLEKALIVSLNETGVVLSLGNEVLRL